LVTFGSIIFQWKKDVPGLSPPAMSFRPCYWNATKVQDNVADMPLPGGGRAWSICNAEASRLDQLKDEIYWFQHGEKNGYLNKPCVQSIPCQLALL